MVNTTIQDICSNPLQKEVLYMNDQCIRAEIKRQYLKKYYQCPGTIVIDELGISYGASRIDIAVIGSELLGYELKSDLDNLNRLPSQVQAYNAVFDELTLVVGYTHAYDAVKIVPQWWGLVFAETDPHGHVLFSYAREPKKNPSPDKFVVAKLLWRDEALQVLDDLGLARGFRSKSRGEICEELAKQTDFEILRSRVCCQIKKRINWRADKLQTLYAH